MKSIHEQIKALTQELRPYPERGTKFWYFTPQVGGDGLGDIYFNYVSNYEATWTHALFASTNKAEVEEYADCYRRLKLYQLLGKKAEKEFPINVKEGFFITDFEESIEAAGGIYLRNNGLGLGSSKFSREEDRLEALKICGIDKVFQKRCAKHGLGGA